ncbi:MAG: glycosyltransferase family 4 protein [Chloroflexi bacterium]|nr:glycosyltransferase family 4 protein [Chloroflexota bacterium]
MQFLQVIESSDVAERVKAGEQTSQDGRRLKILISAYACVPGMSSEPGVGWLSVGQAARRHEVWVLTNGEFKEEIEQELALNPMPNVHWIFVDVPSRLTSFWKKGERGRRIHYNLWQYWAYRAAKELHQIERFDVVHHVTFVSYWTPSYLSLLDAPFIWGPVGGGDSTPFSYYSTLSWKSRIAEVIRDVFRGVSEIIDPFIAMTARRAAVALATTEGTAKKMRRLGARNVGIMNEAALTMETIETVQKPNRHGQKPFRVISIGRLIGWKGYHLGVEAVVKMHQQFPDVEYHILGTGVEADRLKAQIAALGAESYIHLDGYLSRDEVLQKLLDCNVLLHPSLHDSGSWVCMEAMAAGLPVVCLRLGGPATIVDDESGFRPSGENPQRSIDEMAEALVTLAHNPELAARMGEAARRRIHEHFTWPKKGDIYDQIYRELVKTR